MASHGSIGAPSFGDCSSRPDGADLGRGHSVGRARSTERDDRRIPRRRRDVLSFASHSYLGLELDPRLIEAGVQAYGRYGSQTSYSRGYLSCPIYRELEEDLLPRIFQVPYVLLLQSTSSAHHVMMPALLTEKDAAVCDSDVHPSVDDAVTLQCVRSNAKKVVVRHGDLDASLETIEKLARKHQHVWFICDGVYSRYGEFLPSSFLRDVLAVAPNVRMYVDDAHGMSWVGEHGRGHFLSRFVQDERVVLVTALSKGFATGGGVVVVHDRRLVELARLVGGPYSFSGPLRPGDLGAATASARIHLSPELAERQALLKRRVEQANLRSRSLGLSLFVENETPILAFALGRLEAAHLMVQRLRDEGIHLNLSTSASAPESFAGLRIIVNATHTEEEVDSLFDAFARHLPHALEAAGVTPEELADAVREVLPPLLRSPQSVLQGVALQFPPPAQENDRYEIATYARIDDANAASWDRHMGGLPASDTRTLRTLENVFSASNARVEDRWSFRYVEVRDEKGIAAMAPFVTSLMKDDTFMDADVSAALEVERERAPYLFSARAVVMGTMASEGQAMYLRPGPDRIPALLHLLRAGVAEMKEQGCRTLVLRNMGADEEIAVALRSQGFTAVPLPDDYLIHLDDSDDSELVARLSTTTHRKYVRSTQKQAALFDVEYWNERTTIGDDLLEPMHDQYASMAKKNLRINAFRLPPELLRAGLASASWEVLVLKMRGSSRYTPVAWGAARHAGDDYYWLHCGVEYDSTDTDGVSPYRQLLWQLLVRARSLGAKRVHLGTAMAREKQRFGAVATPNFAFVRSEDEHASVELERYVAAIGKRRSGVMSLPDRGSLTAALAGADAVGGGSGPARASASGAAVAGRRGRTAGED